MSRVSDSKSLALPGYSHEKQPSWGAKVVVQGPKSALASPTTPALSWKEKISRFFYGTLGFSSAYHLFDVGFADLLALDILKHGTGLKNYLSISLNGADPTRGGTTENQYNGWTANENWGSGVNLYEYSKNKFFVMHDTDRSNETDCGTVGPGMGVQVPMIYSHMGNSNSTGGNTFLTMMLDCITPVLRFKFTPDAFKAQFKSDRTMPKGCFYTEKPISPLHLGVTGSLIQGINPGMFHRMAGRPIQVLKGMAYLAASYYIGKRTYRYFTGQTAAETKAPVSKTAELRPKQLMTPRKFAVICGLAQAIFRFGLSGEAARDPLLVATSAAALGGIAYLGKRRYNAAKSAEKPQIPNGRMAAVRNQAARVRNVGSTVCGVFFRTIGAHLIAFV